jgi:hypothetical protein
MGRTSKSAAMNQAIPWIKDMMKCPFVNGEVTRATPFFISAGLNPVPAKPNPEMTNSQNATVRRGLASTDAANRPAGHREQDSWRDEADEIPGQRVKRSERSQLADRICRV